MTTNTISTRRFFLLFLLISMLFSAIAFSQSWTGQTRYMQIEGEIFQLPELGALIAAQGDTVSFMMVREPEARPKGYGDIDAKEKDEVLMMNGKRIKSTEMLKEMYEAMAVGDEIKLGVRRDGQMFILSFPKIDPANAPKMVVRTMSAEGDTGEILPLPELRIMLVEEAGKVMVQSLPVDAAAEVSGLDTKEGDALTAINGKAISSTKEFQDIYQSLQTGDTVKIEVSRGGKTVTSSFSKPEPLGKVMIRRSEN